MSGEMQTQWNSSWLDSGNQSYLDSQFEIFLHNPSALSDEWRSYFQDLISSNKDYMDASHADVREFFRNLSYKPKSVRLAAPAANVQSELQQIAVEKLIQSYRLLGHLQSNINPLSEPPKTIKDLELTNFGLDSSMLNNVYMADNLAGAKTRTLQQILQDLHKIYCDTVATEYMHIDDHAERLWVQKNIEEKLLNLQINREDQQQILDLMIAADGLEKYLGAKYPGAKRFSLEGCDSLLVGLDRAVSFGGSNGIEEIIIAMAHRGRLNVLINLLGKVPSELFDLFEERHNMQLESGDVKYHQGFSSDLQTPGGNLHASLVYNPSHLEIVTPVATGSVCARQDRRGELGKSKVMCIAMHGDASFAGQGVAMEVLNMSATRGYGVGGTLHVIVNNQIGFTTSNPKDARSTRYCSDLGKMLSAPIFHVNADDPEAAWAIFELAMEYRIKFQKDVIIDLVGYRRMGHNEADEPSATQPMMYKDIRHHPTAKQIYADKLIAQQVVTAQQFEQMEQTYRNSLDKRDHAVVKRLASPEWKSSYASDWSVYSAKDWRVATKTNVALETLKTLATARDTVPDGFVLDSRVQKIVDARKNMTAGNILVDWGYAETLAYATLLNEGFTVRLSGQDSARGTFFHRHAVWHDQNTGSTYVSLNNLNSQQAKFTVIDSLLSEAAVMGFEYGYSTSEPRCLTIWEAQFGDFGNNAQVVIDQFISSGEQKWGRLSGLVLFLPHGYEGQGPEHSSARIERYLQLCSQHNIQVCIPSTPAQMYHLLRRQMLRAIRKPLIVITPKSLLRNKEAVSSLDQLANDIFKPIIADDSLAPELVKKIIVCSGKVFYELHAARGTRTDIAIIRMEQLYPFPEQELSLEIKKYMRAKKVIWCQEEPQNQGGWYSMKHHVINILNSDQTLTYAGRPESAAPAVGYFDLHEKQQHELVQAAIGEE
jgi:2-oxoglutarate dehydrogenase E1 component